MVREAAEGLEMLVKNMKESTLQTLKEEDQREKKMHEMLEKLEEMQREISQIYPDSLETQMQKLQIQNDSLEMKQSEVGEMMENAERDRERKKLQEPQKHGFFMDEETLRKTYPGDKMERSHLDRNEMLLRLTKLEHQFQAKLTEMTTSKMEMQNTSGASSSTSKDGLQLKMEQMKMDEMKQHCLKELEILSQEIEMKEQEQFLEKIKTHCYNMLQKLENPMNDESAELLSTMQLRLEVNESYIQKQKKVIEKYKEKTEKLEKEALASRAQIGFNEGERTWMNRSEVYAQRGASSSYRAKEELD